MPKFTIGESVDTPDKGVGLVTCVWPKRGAVPTHYNVQVDGQRNAIVYEEGELRAAPPALKGKAVLCRDCALAKISSYIPGSVRCRQFKQLRSAHALRVCRHFKPRGG